MLSGRISQRSPEYLGRHLQVNVLFPSTQNPSLRHGDESHSLISTEQSLPVKPGLHRQVKSLTPSMQVPPLAQGSFLQSL